MTETPADFFCPECGYDLRGIDDSAHCPECGEPLAAVRAPEPQIPWTRRQETGSLRAFCLTAWSASRLFGREIVRNVDYREAQRFRWLTIGYVYFWLLLTQVAVLFIRAEEFRQLDLVLFVLLALMTQIAIVLVLIVLTGVPSYLFHPRRLPIGQQNRAVALSYYACAPLFWTPLVCLALLAGMLLAKMNPLSLFGGVLVAFSGLLAIGLLVAWWFDLIRLARRATRREGPALVLFAIAVPVLWKFSAAMTLAAVGIVLGYVFLVIYSLISV